MKNKKLVILKENIEYILTEKVTDGGVKRKMNRSNNEPWAGSAKGETCITALDTGNEIKLNIGGVKIELDYSQAFELQILLKDINNSQNNLSKFKILKVK